MSIKIRGIGQINGWLLVETQLNPYKEVKQLHLKAKFILSADKIFVTTFPVLQTGRVHELVRLPDGLSDLSFLFDNGESLDASMLTVRRVVLFERIWRMANRVIGSLRRLSCAQRRMVGLTYWKLIFNLSGAYNIVAQLRGYIPYPIWIEHFDVLSEHDLKSIRQYIGRMSALPRFHILLVADEVEETALRVTLSSIQQQLYCQFSCVIFNAEASEFDASVVNGSVRGVGLQDVDAWIKQFNSTLASSGSDSWLICLRSGEVLAQHALYHFACAALARPEAAVLYSDDDLLDANGQRCAPRFKPDWSLTHLRATNFIGDAVALRGSEVVKAGGLSMDSCRHGFYDLLLRVADVLGDEGDKNVVHIPHVLLHQSAVADADEPYCLDAVRSHLARNRIDAEVSGTLPGCRRVRYHLPDEPPMVSIVVPTRDALGLIRQCVESLLEKTTYPRFEILVVDNQSADPDALTYLEQIACYENVRVLHYDKCFNYSAINNFAVRGARGEVVCLLNNDTEVISPGWLEEMVGHLLQSKAGVVGAKLYFPDGRVQHAGDTVGPGGIANHLHSFIERDDPGYCNRAMVAQELSAVTAACLITWRDLYQRLGGLNEKRLPVAFNDVDYCLRVRETGYRVVWTPHAELYHHESVSRGKDTTYQKKWRASREAAYMRKRWRQVMLNDPFYNPNLSYQRPDFSLSHAPLIEQPWKKAP